MKKKILSMAFLVCSALNYSRAAVNFNTTHVNNINRVKDTDINISYKKLNKDLSKKLTRIFNNRNKNNFTSDNTMVSRFIYKVMDFLQQGDGTFIPDHMQNITAKEVFNSQENYNNFIEQVEKYFCHMLKNALILPKMYFYNMINFDYDKPLHREQMILLEQAVFNFNFFVSKVKGIEVNTITYRQVEIFFSTLKHLCALEQRYTLCGVKEELVKIFYTQQNLEFLFQNFINQEGHKGKEQFYNTLILNIFYIFCAEKSIGVPHGFFALMLHGVDFCVSPTAHYLSCLNINYCDNHILYKILYENSILNLKNKKFLIFKKQKGKFLKMFDRIFVDFVYMINNLDMDNLKPYHRDRDDDMNSVNKSKIIENISNKAEVINGFLDVIFFPTKVNNNPIHAWFAIQVQEAFEKISEILNK